MEESETGVLRDSRLFHARNVQMVAGVHRGADTVPQPCVGNRPIPGCAERVGENVRRVAEKIVCYSQHVSVLGAVRVEPFVPSNPVEAMADIIGEHTRVSLIVLEDFRVERVVSGFRYEHPYADNIGRGGEEGYPPVDFFVNVPGGLSFNADNAASAGEDSSVHTRRLGDSVSGVKVAEAADTITTDSTNTRVIVQVDSKMRGKRIVFNSNMTTARTTLKKIIVREIIA